MLIVSSAYPNEEINHEENIESEIDLLGCVFSPRDTFFYPLTEIKRSHQYFNGSFLMNIKTIAKYFYKTIICYIPGCVYKIYNKRRNRQDEHQTDLKLK